MMADMVIKPSGDVDRDFVAMMLPHHQGEIAMAQAELDYGHDEQLRCLARKIIAARQREITTMQVATWRGISGLVPAAAPDAMPRGEFVHVTTPRGTEDEHELD